jgi:hypothetical protein
MMHYLKKIQGHPGQIYHMANPLTLNLELSNDLQVNKVNKQARAMESDTQGKGKGLDQLRHTQKGTEVPSRLYPLSHEL